MSTTEKKLTWNEHVELLTGFDELAIEKAFGTDFDNLRESMMLRALVFIVEKRAGANDKDAYKAVMERSLKAITEHFSNEPDEVNDDDPITESGNGDASSGGAPTT